MSTSSAYLSADRVYRYLLIRTWNNPGTNNGFAMLIGLNPSTADETQNDPTIRRDIGLLKALNYSGLIKVNLYGYRATKPAEMLAARNPVGADNDRLIESMLPLVNRVYAVWGRVDDLRTRQRAHTIHGLIVRSKKAVWCFRETKDGHPSHTLYLPQTVVNQTREWIPR